MFENLLVNPYALIGLLLIPILIILYLLKPKPKDYNFPTLMFIQDIEKKEWLRSLLKRLIKDPLLLVQIFIIALLVFAIADPFYMTEAEVTTGDIILIIDSSASMQATDLGQDRFSSAIDAAREVIQKSGGKVTIITSSDTWDIKLKDSDVDSALKKLDSLKVSNKGTNIAYTICSAGNVFEDSADADADSKKKRILYVFSDFAGCDVPENVMESKRKLETENVVVNLKKIGASGNNVGIIDAGSYRTGETRCLVNFKIANYNSNPVNLSADVLVSGKIARKINANINSFSKEFFKQEINCFGDCKIEVKINPAEEYDALLTDNYVSFSAPKFKQILFNSDDSELLKTINDIPNLKVTEGDETMFDINDFDLVISDKIFDKNKIRDYTAGGKSFIFTAPKTLYTWDYDNIKEILPVVIEMENTKAKVIEKNTGIITNFASSNSNGEFNINFDEYFLKITKYHAAKKKDEASDVLAYAEDGSVLIAKNKIIYYVNFNSDWTNINEIPTDISYLTMWHQLIKTTMNDAEIDCLCSEMESDIMPGNIESYEIQIAGDGDVIKAESKNYLFKYLLVLGVILLFLEMFYLRLRGQV
ncbi:MAG: hypothetical protein CVT90_00300 [Candidatus Altiarchaeales archaeon HGW-Altiarchaeales-3]|nr:MAG: hypothetical protein CVT90_00300 [Candidatus Altiarchaeales archaeon HGW-Altiarchaeales-3]